MTEGTPKTMLEAIANGLESIGVEGDPFVPSQEALVRFHVKDFCAQKFATALLKARKNPEAQEALQELFKTLFKEVV